VAWVSGLAVNAEVRARFVSEQKGRSRVGAMVCSPRAAGAQAIRLAVDQIWRSQAVCLAVKLCYTGMEERLVEVRG